MNRPIPLSDEHFRFNSMHPLPGNTGGRWYRKAKPQVWEAADIATAEAVKRINLV
jgi:hypothetical protein